MEFWAAEANASWLLAAPDTSDFVSSTNDLAVFRMASLQTSIAVLIIYNIIYNAWYTASLVTYNITYTALLVLY